MTTQIFDNFRKYIATFIHTTEGIYSDMRARSVYASWILICEIISKYIWRERSSERNNRNAMARTVRRERAQGSLSGWNKQKLRCLHLSHVPMCSCHTNCYIIAHWFDAFRIWGEDAKQQTANANKGARALTEIENVKKWIVEMGKFKFKSKSFSF